MAESRAEFNRIPDVDFKINTSGITVICSRLYMPRFIEFDIKGKCNTCKCDMLEVDFVVTIDGITIYCSRINRLLFVPFDYKYKQSPLYCLFRVKSRGKVFNIDCGKNKQPAPDILNQAIDEVLKEDQNFVGKNAETNIQS